MANVNPGDGSKTHWGGEASLTYNGVTFYISVGAYTYYTTSSANYSYGPRMRVRRTGSASTSFTLYYSGSLQGQSFTGSIYCPAGGGSGDSIIKQTDTRTVSGANAQTVTISGTFSWRVTTSGSYVSRNPSSLTLNFSKTRTTWTFKSNGGSSADQTRTGYYHQEGTAPSSAGTKSSPENGQATVYFDFNDGGRTPMQSTIITVTGTRYYNLSSWGSVSPGGTFTFDTIDRTLNAQWAKGELVGGGQQVALPFVADRVGYIFNGWYYEGTYQGTSGGTSATAFKSDATITADWTAKDYSYAVYYKGPSGEDLFPMETGTAKFGRTVTITAKTKNGYTADSKSKSLVMADQNNVITFNYSLVNNKIAYNVGTYGTLTNPLTSYNIQSGEVDSSTLKKYIVLPVPTIKPGYEQWSFVGWTGGGITTPTTEVVIWTESQTYDGGTTTYTANYERVSKRWKGAAGIWRPIMNVYVKGTDGKWHLVPKGNSFVKLASGWTREATED